MRRSKDQAGGEPDESYTFSKSDDGPELVIEVNWTRGGIDKLEIYRRLGIREVWEANQISVHVLGSEGYAVQPHSSFLPGLDLELVIRLLEIDDVVDLHTAMRDALAGS
jgi:Uma2 family endonuclease